MIKFQNEQEKQLWIARTMRGDSYQDADVYVVQFRARVAGIETLWLLNIGPRKIEVVKALREYLGLNLKDAKELAESAPCALPVSTHELTQRLRVTGATLERRAAK